MFQVISLLGVADPAPSVLQIDVFLNEPVSRFFASRYDASDS